MTKIDIVSEVISFLLLAGLLFKNKGSQASNHILNSFLNVYLLSKFQYYIFYPLETLQQNHFKCTGFPCRCELSLVYRWLLETSRQQMLRILWSSLNSVHMRQHGVFLGHRPSPGKPSLYSSAGCT